MCIHTHTHTKQETCPGHKIGRPHLEKRHFASFNRTDHRQYSRKGTGRTLPSQGLPEYSTGKSGAAPPQLQVKDPSVLRQAVPGSQSSSLLSHSSKSVRHVENKTELLRGLEGCGGGTLPAVYRQPRGKRIAGKVKNYQSDQFWAVLRTGMGWGRVSAGCRGCSGRIPGPGAEGCGGGGRAERDTGQSSVTSEQPGGEQAPPTPWSQAEGPRKQDSPGPQALSPPALGFYAQLLYLLTAMQGY